MKKKQIIFYVSVLAISCIAFLFLHYPQKDGSTKITHTEVDDIETADLGNQENTFYIVENCSAGAFSIENALYKIYDEGNIISGRILGEIYLGKKFNSIVYFYFTRGSCNQLYFHILNKSDEANYKYNEQTFQQVGSDLVSIFYTVSNFEKSVCIITKNDGKYYLEIYTEQCGNMGCSFEHTNHLDSVRSVSEFYKVDSSFRPLK